MSTEHFEMSHDCIIVPNCDCPDDCELQNVSKYDILSDACETNGNPTFYQYVDQDAPVMAHLAAIRLNMKWSLKYNVSPKSCINLQKLLKTAWNEE